MGNEDAAQLITTGMSVKRVEAALGPANEKLMKNVVMC
jgi:hypothetical protein